MKNKRMVITFILILTMLVSMTSTVFASDSDDLTLKGSIATVSEDLLMFIEENDIYLDNDSSIEVFPVATNSLTSKGTRGFSTLENEDVAIAVVVTNEQDDTVYKDVLLSIYDLPTDGIGISPFAADYGNSASWEKRLTIHGVAQADIYAEHPSFYYYSPQAVGFSYTKGTGSNVTYISTQFITQGDVYSKSFVYRGYSTTYIIEATATNPSQYTQYERVSPFDSSSVIYKTSGDLFIGTNFIFTYYVDGARGECSVPIF